MNIFDLYVLFVLLPAIHSLSAGALAISMFSGIGSVMAGIGAIAEDKPINQYYGLTIAKLITVPALLLALIFSLFPDEKQVAMLAGGYVAIEVSQMEEAKKLPDNVFKAMNNYLEKVQE